MTPQPCPICHGRGSVVPPQDITRTLPIGDQPCRTCFGTGLVFCPPLAAVARAITVDPFGGVYVA